jgi:hypothetical protein
MFVFVQGSSIIPLSKQVEQFAAVQRNISSRVGNGAAADALLSRSLFLVSTGGNDLFAFFSRNSTPSDADKQRFVGNLVALYQNHVKVRRSLNHAWYWYDPPRKTSLKRNVRCGRAAGRRRFYHIRLCTCSGRGSSR